MPPFTLTPHHAESLRRTTAHFAAQPEVQALLLGGSLAHGWAGPTSDVDVMILVSDETYAGHQQAGQLSFSDHTLCTYAEGYVDGKYLPLSFLPLIAERGSEPARFAFQDAQVLFARVAGLDTALAAITRYPVAGLVERQRRFYAQFEGWRWFAGEALKRDNRYLLGVAVSKLVLFGGRLILAHNHRLYPYHKWLLRQVELAPDRPAALLDVVARLYDAPTADSIDTFFQLVRDFQPWPAPPTGWPTQFVHDSELNWLTGAPPIDDL